MENSYMKIDNGFNEGYIKPAVYVKQEPQITDDGIYMPERKYVLEGTCGNYLQTHCRNRLQQHSPDCCAEHCCRSSRR